MASLENVAVKDSYTSLLKLNGNTDSTAVGDGSNAVQVKTGDDDATPLYLNTDRIGIGGQPSARLHLYNLGDATNNELLIECDSSSGGATGNNMITMKREDTNRANEIKFVTHAHGGSATHKFSLGQTDSDEAGVDGTEFYIGRASGGANPDFAISSAGNVGIGASPNSFHADQTYLQIGGTGSIFSQTAVGASKSMYIGQNIQFDTDGSVDVITEDESSLYEQNGGRHYFYTAPSHASVSALSIQLVLNANSRISLSNNDGNTDNTVFGYNAFTNNGTVLGGVGADRNVAIGDMAMGTGTTTGGVNNVAIGTNALTDHISADSCVAVGAFALHNVTSGIRNLGIGTESGAIVTTGSDNISIGTSSNLTSSSASNQIVIGVSATAQGDNSVTLGNASVTDVYMSQDSQAYVHAQNVPNHVANTMSSPYYRFDGSNDYILTGDNTAIGFGTGDFTISFWVYSEDFAQNIKGLVSLANSSSTTGILIRLTSAGKIESYLGDGSWSSALLAPTVLANSKWHYITVLRTSGTQKIYINTVEDVSAGSRSQNVGQEDLTIGRSYANADDYYFEGQITNVKLYNKALTTTEIKDDYSGASVPFKYKGANQTNMLTNPNFDSDTSSWSAQNSSLSSDSGGQSGNCLTVTRSSSSNQSAYQDFTTIIGKRYMFSAYVKSGTSGNESFDVLLHNPSGSAYNITTGTSSSSWVQYSVEFTATGTTTQAKLRKNTSTAGTMLFDTCNVVPIGAVCEFDGSGVTSTKWWDGSGNDLHGTVSGATSENMPSAPRVSENHPAFQVKPSSNQTNLALGTVDVVFGTEIFDQGGNFSSNTFTAPMTGKYQLNLNLYLTQIDSAVDYYQVTIVTSNRTYYGCLDPDFGQDNAYFPITLAVLADMDINDTAKIQFETSSGSATADVNNSTIFSGYLVC